MTYELEGDTDDGMYVRHDELLKFAKAQGWTPGGGWPSKNPSAPAVDIAAFVAAVMAAMQVQPRDPLPTQFPPEVSAAAAEP